MIQCRFFMVKCRRDFFSIILTTILCYVGMEEVCLSYTPNINTDATAAIGIVNTPLTGKDITTLTGREITKCLRKGGCSILSEVDIQKYILDRDDIAQLELYISLEDYYANKDLIKDCVYFSDDGYLGVAKWDPDEHTGCQYLNNNTERTLYHWYNGTLTELQGVSFLRQSTIKICEDKLQEEQKQYFMSHCGNKAIGINLLKGFSGYNNERICNFYDYSSDAKNVNMDNLRNFFAGNLITYTNQTKEQKKVSADHVKTCLRIFLTVYCNPFNNNTKPKCVSKCPLDGVTEGESSYTYQMFRGNTDFPSVLNWNIKTIADCGVKDFQDDAGYYFFGDSDTNKTLVKYSNTNDPGSRFYY